ncbi:hypothetical protein ACFL0Q_04875 [Thermodesulfobacteriota bacterium]
MESLLQVLADIVRRIPCFLFDHLIHEVLLGFVKELRLETVKAASCLVFMSFELIGLALDSQPDMTLSMHSEYNLRRSSGWFACACAAQLKKQAKTEAARKTRSFFSCCPPPFI